MTPHDVALVLAKAAAFDRRTVGDSDVVAWLEAIGDLDVADALAAVTAHYRDSTDWLMPAHVRLRVRAAIRLRAEQERARLRAVEAAHQAVRAITADQAPPEALALLAEFRRRRQRRGGDPAPLFAVTGMPRQRAGDETTSSDTLMSPPTEGTSGDETETA